MVGGQPSRRRRLECRADGLTNCPARTVNSVGYYKPTADLTTGTRRHEILYAYARSDVPACAASYHSRAWISQNRFGKVNIPRFAGPSTMKSAMALDSVQFHGLSVLQMESAVMAHACQKG